uniref:Leucine rich immune protein (Coil-less) n=1 Tax=Anopheles christyi TaxID=43041 RepID=A0A182K1Q3_9DIPT
MENFLRLLLVFVILQVSYRSSVLCSKKSTVLMSVSDDMDQTFFAQVLDTKLELHVWHTESKKLEVNSDNPLQALLLMEAPKLEVFVFHPNHHLRQLVVRFCTLDGLAKDFLNLQELSVLQIEQCRLNGTFNLGELIALHNLTSFSLEANRLTETVLQLDEIPDEPEQGSKLAILNLSFNKIKYFNLNVLRLFPALKELFLSHNALATVEGSIFLPELVKLDIKQNLLDVLDISGCNCSSLLYLYASNNRLMSFPIFSETTLNIDVLDLGNNRLTVANGKELQKQRKLTTLILSWNAFSSFTTDDENELEIELASLHDLDLSSNQLKSLDLRDWKLPSLSRLHVSNNPLKVIPDDLMERYPNLTKLVCFCPDIDCAWIQHNVEHIRSGNFEMSVVWQGPTMVGKDYRCVTVP